MNNSADLGGCYPQRPSASVDKTLLDLQNYSYPTQPHLIIAKYANLGAIYAKGLYPMRHHEKNCRAKYIAKVCDSFHMMWRASYIKTATLKTVCSGHPMIPLV